MPTEKLLRAWSITKEVSPVSPAEYVMSFNCSKSPSPICFVLKEVGEDVDGIVDVVRCCVLNQQVETSTLTLSPTVWTVVFDAVFTCQILSFFEYSIEGLYFMCHYDIPSVIIDDEDIELMFLMRRLCLHPECNHDDNDSIHSTSDEETSFKDSDLKGKGALLGFDLSLLSIVASSQHREVVGRIRPFSDRFRFFCGEIQKQIAEYYVLMQHFEDSIDDDSIEGSPDHLELLEAMYSKADVKIVDLGNSCWINKHFTDDIQTRQYRAPEVLIGAGYNTSADMWSYACIVFELLTGDLLFDPHAGSNWDRDEDHLAMMIELVGTFPRKLIMSGIKSAQYFNKRGELKHIDSLKIWKLPQVLTEKYRMSSSDAEDIADFLGGILEVILQYLTYYPIYIFTRFLWYFSLYNI